ncbi:MAG: Omp28-related outer membrane protein [Flavobacteriales bacterium]|nr:Omp28-related outer membrane protein [Flavobacteriales bacterium]
MKKFLFLYFVLFTMITSCDIIDNPIVDYGIGYREDLYGSAPTFGPATNSWRNVLLEDFTGHDCGNCPDAHVVADEILANNPGRVAVVSIHAGPLAEPLLPDFPNDYRTTEGEFYFAQLSFQVNPIGRVSREGGASNIWSHAQWTAEAINQMNDAPAVVLQMELDMDTVLGNLNIHVYDQWLQASSGNQNLVLLITEGPIIGPQLEYTPEAIIHEDYEHKHMLRAAISGPDGLSIANSPVQGEAGTSSYTYEWNSNWKWGKSYVVAFVVNASNGEVLNVIEKKIYE